MKIALLGLAALLLIVPAIAGGQALTGVTPVPDSAPSAYATIKANRAGISADEPVESSSPVRSDPTFLGHHISPRLIHARNGAAVGALAGAVIGAGVGAAMDSRHGEGFLSGPVIVGLAGAMGGVALGAIVGALWPVK